MEKEYENERKQLACLAAFYIGELGDSIFLKNKEGVKFPSDSLIVMNECVKFADEYDFEFREENGETVIKTEKARNDAHNFAKKFINDNRLA